MVVLVPESGDSIQTLKAGLMEIADIFLVNKSDRPGSDRLRNEIELMLGMRGGDTLKNVPGHHGHARHHESIASLEDKLREGSVVGSSSINPARAAREAAKANSAESWTPPVLRSVAIKQEGTPEILAALDRHAQYLVEGGVLTKRRRKRLTERVVEIVERTLQSRLWNDSETSSWLGSRIPELESGKTNPFAVAQELVARSGDVMTGRAK